MLSEVCRAHKFCFKSAQNIHKHGKVAIHVEEAELNLKGDTIAVIYIVLCNLEREKNEMCALVSVVAAPQDALLC